MTSRQTVALAAGLLACGVVGAVAGVDAGGHVDAFYTTPRVRPERVPPMPVSSPYDWDQPPASTTTWASATSGQSVAIVSDGRSDGSDLTEIDRAVERAGAVRIHRARPAQPARAVVDLPAEDPAPDAPTT